MSRYLFLLAFFCLTLQAASCKNKALKKVDDPRLGDISLPAGFSISIFADSVKNARSLALGSNGTVFVSSRDPGKIYALVDQDGNGFAEQRYTIASGMNEPNGIAFKDGSLYIAEIDKIYRLDDIEKKLNNPGKPALIYDDLPHDRHHGWKYIAFGPDGKLYLQIGAPCNICDDNITKDPRYATIDRINPDGTGFEIFAHGVRNTVGFDWHPQTGELWFTENGRDNMGDNIPADELNRAPVPGLNFGYPFCHAGDILDPEFGKGKNCADYVAPEIKLNPHGAALGMRFYTGRQFPAAYQNQIFIAEHGSWNRSEPIGYQVSLVKLENGKAVSFEPFATGWLKNGQAWGRPVDVLVLRDGSLLVSDDYANVVYRISYQKQ